ncbi:MAG TPA: TetR/AcrR family transcriptional regulator [Candidatus Limnocylindrales bacterium]|nr:TetR/AcrR family transcriptional regulator [Candidatus Limnocylindrales bacterium]
MNLSTRPYRMTARAEAVAETRERIVAAAVALHLERLASEISLADVAGRAGVSVQTVLRHFGSREGLTTAAEAWATSEIERERRSAPGDVSAALRALVEHYERRGDGVLLLLAQEPFEPFAARATGQGRTMHRRWVEEVFGPLLPEGRRAEAIVDLLVVATDVYTWKLLRRDRRLSARVTSERMEALVRAVLAQPPR